MTAISNDWEASGLFDRLQQHKPIFDAAAEHNYGMKNAPKVVQIPVDLYTELLAYLKKESEVMRWME